MTSTSEPGQHLRSRCSSTSTATSTPPRRTCRRRSPRRCASCRRASLPPSLPEGEPGRLADPVPARSPRPTLPLSAARRVRRERASPSGISTVDGRGAGAGVRLAEVRGAHPARPAGAGRARHRHRRGARRGRSRQREPADRHPVGHRPGLHRAGRTASSQNAHGVPAAGRGLPQRRAGAAQDLGQVIDDVQDNQAASWFNGDARPSCSPSSGSPAPTPWRWRTRVQAADRAARGRSCPASVEIADALRPLGVDPRLGARRASSRCCSRCAWWCW